MPKRRKPRSNKALATAQGANAKVAYSQILGAITESLQAARRATARTGSAITTATNWEIGRRIVEFEQAGAKLPIYENQCDVPFSSPFSSPGHHPLPPTPRIG
jgi:hypothetical protein